MPIDSLAAPNVGYTMQLVRDAVMATDLLRPKTKGTTDIGAWYAECGGLRRRLRLMANACDLLSEVHSRGLCYGDISPRNICISGDIKFDNAWLIDADNLRYEVNGGASNVLTPGYAAPEIMCSTSRCTTLSDAHSIAVVAFQALSLVHPLCGDSVSNGTAEDEERALRGQLPWIEHNQDASNRSSVGIPRELVLSPGLKKIFSRFFEAGLTDFRLRPSVASLASALDTAADFTIRCGTCRHTFYALSKACPFCKAPRRHVVVLKATRWEPEMARSVDLTAPAQEWPRAGLPFVSIPIGETMTLSSRVIFGATGMKGKKEAIRVGVNEALRVTIERLDATEFYVGAAQSTKVVPIKDRSEIPITAWLRTGPIDKPHRIFQFVQVQQ